MDALDKKDEEAFEDEDCFGKKIMTDAGKNN